MIFYETLLHIAALRGSKDIVAYLISQNFDVNCKTLNFQDTPLHLAVQEGHDDIVQMLLDAKADPNETNCEILI
ncbi:hypothetical protein TRFO_01896 [Tritrichomonas foetus]|uniref:Uncharacterized protein n=1 Tax=Tritrichomonas foetus TaxID=1144522 RepID=A0A1J4JJN8_9EUKA|nr:hypothetical protein TRFO_01896 [Tritrichomonas foetus]|eukprot:OHS98825.1 hypothetical protein TRFO_01896 [Tritrichomonas foetus]